MIPLEMLEEMFENMRETPGMDVASDLLWGYFFFAATARPLRSIAEELEQAGYRFVDIFENDAGRFTLHVELVETHSPQSLFERNSELSALAAKYKAIYDGMDVGFVE